MSTDKLNSKLTGFTIVELIVVIVVIAILAAITLVTYGGVKDRAKATAVVNEIKNVEKAFNLMAADQFVAEWWKDNYFNGSGNPTFESIIASNSDEAKFFKKYIPTTPKISGENLTWTYDNDKDSIANPSSCPKTNWLAVNLQIGPMDKSLIQHVDKMIDDGVLNCGRITQSGSNLQYQLSDDQKI